MADKSNMIHRNCAAVLPDSSNVRVVADATHEIHWNGRGLSGLDRKPGRFAWVIPGVTLLASGSRLQVIIQMNVGMDVDLMKRIIAVRLKKHLSASIGSNARFYGPVSANPSGTPSLLKSVSGANLFG